MFGFQKPHQKLERDNMSNYTPPLQVSPPNPTTQLHSLEDCCYLQALPEANVFLHDGAFRSLASLNELKEFERSAPFQDALNDVSSVSQLEELISIGGRTDRNNVKELSRRIVKLATLHVQSIGLHHRYQWSVLQRLWKYQHTRALHSKESEQNGDTSSGVKQHHHRVNLEFRLSLCLLVPMLDIYANQNREVALSTMKLLFDELGSLPIASLRDESSRALNQLEELLGRWAATFGGGDNTNKSASGAAGALVAFACARGTAASFTNAWFMLENLEKRTLLLPVGGILDKLEEARRGFDKPCGLQPDKHLLTWPYDDRLLTDSLAFGKTLGGKTHSALQDLFQLAPEIPAPPVSTTGAQSNKNTSPAPVPEEVRRHFVATDGHFLFTTGPDGRGLAKIGTGLRGTLQGWVYQYHLELSTGFVAFADGILISRPLELDSVDEEKLEGQQVLGTTLNTSTLRPDKLIFIEHGGGRRRFKSITLGLTSDGSALYWVRAELPSTPVPGGTFPQPGVLNVWLEVFYLIEMGGGRAYSAVAQGNPLMLTRVPEEEAKANPPSGGVGGSGGTAATTSAAVDERGVARRTRSVRLANTPLAPPPPPLPIPHTPAAVAAGGVGGSTGFEMMNTTLNVTLKQLMYSMYVTCGNFLTVISSNNSQLLMTPAFGPSSGVAATMRQYAPVLSPSCPKSLGIQIHVNLHSPTSGAGSATKQDLQPFSGETSFFHGAIIPEMGATYDAINNVIWLINGQLVDSFRNPGHVPMWKLEELLPLTIPSTPSQHVDIRTIISALVRHTGTMASHFLHGDLDCAIISPHEADGLMKTCLELIFKYRSSFQGPELIAIFLILQAAVVTRFSKTSSTLDPESDLYTSLHDIQVILLSFLSDATVSSKKFRASLRVYKQACKLFAAAFDLVYIEPKTRQDFFLDLYDFLDGDEGMMEGPRRTSLLLLESQVLQHFADSLSQSELSRLEEGQKWIVGAPWLAKIVQGSIDEIRTIFSKLAENGFPLAEVIQHTASLPMITVSTSYINAVVNFLLRCLTLQKAPPATTREAAIEVFREVLKAGPTLVEVCVESISFPPETEESLRHINFNLSVYNACEAILKSSILGYGIPQILAFLSSYDCGMKPILDELTEECIHLTIALSFLAKKLHFSSDAVGGLVDDWSSRVRVPAPWSSRRVSESPHPVREGTKVKEVVLIPGARQLLLKLSPQSASQYDYDRLIISSGVTPSARKVAEFGGNYYGFGNRYFLGPGWARGPVCVEGHAASVSFEMKSGREHGVPDKALYGFHLTAFPVIDYSDPQKPSVSGEKKESDENSISLPSVVTPSLVALSTLHCVDIVQSVVRSLLAGGDLSSEEIWSRPLLENRLVASLQWSSKQQVIASSTFARVFPSEVVAKLKRTVGVQPLQMRLSISEKTRASELEELYLQACLLHIGANPYLNTDMLLSTTDSSSITSSGAGLLQVGETGRDLLREIFRNIDTMFRRLMTFYEMEKMFCQEVEEISNNTKDIREAFFNDPAFQESPIDMQTLAWICYFDYDKENPMNLINDVIAMVHALSADTSSPPQLNRSEELIEETHSKVKHLISAKPSSNSSFLHPNQQLHIGPPFPSQKEVLQRLHSLHAFITAHLNYSPSTTMAAFAEARRQRRERATDRIRGLDILHRVLACSSPTSVLLIVTSFLLQSSGPRLQSIMCSGLESEVIKSFGEVLKTAVGIAEKDPLLHRHSIALLSVTAYEKTDEVNLVESGLLGLLDQLCAYQTAGHLTPLYRRNSPVESSNNSSNQVAAVAAHTRASTLAWAAFQVLASQCASWEQQRTTLSATDNFDEDYTHSDLPLQISFNVTNHLARAAALAALSSNAATTSNSSGNPVVQTCSPSLTVAIQDVLELLSNLRTAKIGRAILKQSHCICRLLGLLQDSRLSPRLVLTILKLLHTALPLVDDLDSANFQQIVPTTTTTSHHRRWGYRGNMLMNSFWTMIEATPYTQVASMLLTKLADYLVCAPQQKAGESGGHNRSSNNHCQPAASQDTPSSPPGLTDPKIDKLEVWLTKCDHLATSAALVRQLFMDSTRQDLKPSRGTLSELEGELNSNGKVLVYTDDAEVAERKAIRISQLAGGHLVTLIPPNSSSKSGANQYTTSGGAGVSSTRGSGGSANELLCKERNTELSSWDPARPFLSGHVAENLASEIVQLVRALLQKPSNSSTKLEGKGSSSSSSSSTTAEDEKKGDNSTTSVSNSGGETHKMMEGENSSIPTTSWPAAVEQVICATLKLIPKLTTMPLTTGTATQQHHLFESVVYSGRLIIAALTVLGGFSETIRPGLEVWILGNNQSQRETLLEPDEEEANEEWDYTATRARVISVSESSPTSAKVELISSVTKGAKEETTSLPVVSVVPVCRLVPGHFQPNGEPALPTLSKHAQQDLATCLKALLIQNSSTATTTTASKHAQGSSSAFPLRKPLPTLNEILSFPNTVPPDSSNDSSSTTTTTRQIAQTMTIVRLLAEIRTKAMQVLSLWLRRREFASIFLGFSSESQFNRKFGTDLLEVVDNLKAMAKECYPTHKANSLERQVAWMRLIYRDCTKPPRLPVPSASTPPPTLPSSLLRWDLARLYPKIRATVFSSATNSVVFTGDYAVTSGNPRGVVLFGSGVIPSTTGGYYWEATVVSMEETGTGQQHPELIVMPPLSIGYATEPPAATPPNDVWKYPPGTVMYTTLGRVVHYKTQDPGSWATLRLDDDNFRIRVGDTIGIGWEKGQQQSNNSGGSGNTTTTTNRLRILSSSRRQRSRNMANLSTADAGVRGCIYFTLNGRRLPPSVEQSNAGLHPIIHIQRRQMVVHTNLGETPFLYQDANSQRQQTTTTSASGVPPPPQVVITTAETGTSNADVLLRRVSDSLQDLNLVFNIDLRDFDSEQELNDRRTDGSSSSTASNRAEDEDDWDDDDEDSDDDDDQTEAAMSEPNIPRQLIEDDRVHQHHHLLPPTPASGSSVSVQRHNQQRRPRPPTPLPGGRKRLSYAKALLKDLANKDGQGVKKRNEVVAKPLPRGEDNSSYNPVTSLEYFLGYAPTAGIRVFGGPLRYTCPCAGHTPTPLDALLLKDKPEDKTSAELDSVDGYEDDDEDEDGSDVHALLVKAWEAQVFPVIRRRFRNESERRDGLEQIRGALLLGMSDIARQTVEFLYEEGGGIPRDLHFPTLEEVRAESARCTMDKVRPGMSVTIRGATGGNNNTGGGTTLPGFAVAAMMRTFGLVGEVLEVDSRHDLVLVETYTESEGMLVRFWYPVSELDKAPITLAKRPKALNASTVNMFKLHSNLIGMEGSLCHLYSRASYLSIMQQCGRHLEGLESGGGSEDDKQKISPLTAQIYYDFDLESIQILSDNLLSNFPPSRDLFTFNLQCEPPSVRFLTDPGNPSVLFYKDSVVILEKALQHQIRFAYLHTGEDGVNELTSKLLHVLECPERFLHHDLTLDKIHDLEVSLPGAAFTLVSFKGPQTAKHLALIDLTVHPSFHLSATDSSELCRSLCACYPLEPLNVVMHRAAEGSSSSIVAHITTTATSSSPTSSSSKNSLRKRHLRFPPILTPSDRLHCSVSDFNLPDVTADIQGLPKEFPLALLYLQQLIKEFHLKGDVNVTFANITCALTHLLDFLDKVPLPPGVKDWIFPLIAELVRVVSNKDGDVRGYAPTSEDRVSKSSTPNRLFLELLLLRDKEALDTTPPPSYFTPLISALSENLVSSPPQNQHNHSRALKRFLTPAALIDHISSFIASHRKRQFSDQPNAFSFYFNALNDVCLALNEVSELMANPYEIIPSISTTSDNNVSDTSPATQRQRSLSSLSTASSTRTIVKAVRKLPPTTSKGQKKFGGNSGTSTSSSKVIQGANPSTEEDGLLAFARASEVDWFNSEVVICRCLRSIVWSDHSHPSNAIEEAAISLISTALDRIKAQGTGTADRFIVIDGAPSNIDGMSVEASLIRALRTCGGFHGNEIWISTGDNSTSTTSAVVVEIRSSAKVAEAVELLKQNKVWYPLEDYVLYPPVNVFRVDGPSLEVSDSSVGDAIWKDFLKTKLADPELSDKLSFQATEVLSSIFMSCYSTSIPFVVEESSMGEEEEEMEENQRNVILLSEEQLRLNLGGNLLQLFFSAVETISEEDDLVKDVILRRFGEEIGGNSKNTKKEEKGGIDKKVEERSDFLSLEDTTSSGGAVGGKGLTLRGFLEWCTEVMRSGEVQLVWKGVFAAGFDIRLQRIWLSEDPSTILYSHFHYNSSAWSLEKDAALISFVDTFSRSLHLDPSFILPNEIHLVDRDLLVPSLHALQGVDPPTLRLRWAMLQKLNGLVAKKLLPLVSLQTSGRSVGNLLKDSRHLLLYTTKDAFLQKLITASATRGSDTATPEITLDPVSSIGSGSGAVDPGTFTKQLVSVVASLSTISSAFYCVPPAQGADPALPLSVKFQGEEVLGLSGSFRHFLLAASKELTRAEGIKLLTQCPSAAAGKNKDLFILTPGNVTHSEEGFLHFLGQLIGISLRADAPLPLPLLGGSWRALLFQEVFGDDLADADVLCETYLKTLESLSTTMAFDSFLSHNAHPRFHYPSMDSSNSSPFPLCPQGSSLPLAFTNRDTFIRLVRQFRSRELRSTNRVSRILVGLSTLIPLPPLLSLFTADHFELRVSGSPEVNLSLLKEHTHYQVGISENDPHVLRFWAALDSFTSDELRKFIKFAANLERLPATCPCQTAMNTATTSTTSGGGVEQQSSSVVHVPPFPMKIAPIDLPTGTPIEEIDRRLIRVETCLFLIRLPPYSSLQVTRDQLLFAINCREDPLSG